MKAETTPDPANERHRVLAASSPAGWAWYASRGTWVLARHLELIARAVIRCLTTGGRLLIECPPRHGKSEFVSRYLPGWFAGAFPGKRVVVASYSDVLPRRNGRHARADFSEHGPTVFGASVRDDTSAAQEWATTKGSEFLGVGVGGGLTGRGADLLVLDDLQKDAEAAQSEVQREGVWDWLEQVALIRLEPGAAVVAITTRWHEDDVHGRLLERQPGRWTRIRLPAMAEEGDPMGRKPGEALWPERYPVEALDDIRSGMSSRAWSALFQQSPSPAGGDVWHAEWWSESRYDIDALGRYVIAGHPVPLSSMRRFCVVDLATSTKTSADYTVVSTFGLAPQGRLVWLGCLRKRMEGPDVLPAIQGELSRWGGSLAYIEDSGFQLSTIQDARRRGMPVRTWGRKLDAGHRVEGDKVALAYSATPYVEQGKVWLPRALPWVAQAEAELLAFPNGAHDDVADTFAVGVRIGMGLVRAHTAVSSVRRVERPVRRDAFETSDTDLRRVFS